MKRGERVPQPYMAAQLLESMEEVGFLLFLGPGDNLFVLPPYELGPQLRSYLHEHWDGVMHIVREAGGVLGVCPQCGGRTFWRQSEASIACLGCADAPPLEADVDWYQTEPV